VSDMTSDITAPRQRNVALIAIVAVVALAALGLGGYVLLGGDADVDGVVAASDDDVAVTNPDPEPTPAPDALAVGVEALPVVTYDVFLSRDPFDPVVPEPVAAASDGGSSEVQVIDDTDTSGGANDGSNDGSSGDGYTDGSGGDDGNDDDGNGDAGSEACRGGTEEVVCDGHVLSLLSLTTGADTVAVVQVDTETYEVQRGQVFAERFLFLDVVDERTVRLLYGDEVFHISIGERVMK
jgi:hypothetical protein